MKFVDQNTFIVSLLLGILVIYKVLSIDGFTDILWIILMGSLTIKGLRSSFSKELHERDIRQAYQKKVGKFAYIALDIPLLTIILAGIIAYVSPDAAMFKVLIAVFSGIFRGICSMDQSVYCKA